MSTVDARHFIILHTTLHEVEFGLRQDQNDPSKSFIFNKGPLNKGPEYIATLNLYSVLRYVPSLFGIRSGAGPYPGRDPIHDWDLVDRVGAVLGVGITEPTRRFAAGASIDLFYGVSTIWVADFARIKRVVDEVSLNVPFKGPKRRSRPAWSGKEGHHWDSR